MSGSGGDKELLHRTGPARPRVNPHSQRGAIQAPMRLAALWGEDDVLAKHSVQQIHAWYGRAWFA